MGWDLIVLNVMGEQKKLAELSDNAVVPLGSTQEVVTTIHRVFPDADIRDPTWIVVTRDSYSLEISIERSEPVESFSIHVHGDISAVNAISELVEASRWSILDAALGDFIDFSSGEQTEGYKRSIEYKNQILRR